MISSYDERNVARKVYKEPESVVKVIRGSNISYGMMNSTAMTTSVGFRPQEGPNHRREGRI